MGWEQGRRQYENRHIVVLGMAKSGRAAAKLLHRFGAHVVVNDRKPEEACPEAEELKEMGITVVCGHHPESIVHPGVDEVVKNPGIPYSLPPVMKAQSLNIPVVTEVEVAGLISSAPLIGISGSNGKTTTTALVGEMLKQANLPRRVAGNIGTVLSETAVEAASDEWLVAELSSFQLAGTQSFAPRIGALLNIYEAHMDYHKTMEHYISSKMKLFQNQKNDDIAILNADDPILREQSHTIGSDVYWFGVRHPVSRGVTVQDDWVVYRTGEEEILRILPVRDIALPGDHNVENALAASMISLAAGASLAGVREALQSFQGVEHRLEYVDTIAGIRYYNDSKATNANASLKALHAFQEPIVYIAGGLDRGTDFHELNSVFASGKIKYVAAYGEAGARFIRLAENHGVPAEKTDRVEEAASLAYRAAVPGDVVLLSPACASWDMHASFEERGRRFKQTVQQLKTRRQA